MKENSSQRIEPQFSGQQLDSRVQTFVICAIGLALAAGPVGYELGAYGTIFFYRIYSSWFVVTAALISMSLVPAQTIPFPKKYLVVLLIPSLWMLTRFLAPAESIEEVLFPLLFVLAMVSYLLCLPYSIYLIIRMVKPEFLLLPGKRPKIYLAAVLMLFLGVGFFFGKNHPRMLTCDDFLVSGSHVPENCMPAGATPLTERPNILLIVADDLGYSDLGSFGGEINTPNLDSLAREGVALRRFHAAPNCGPSRASMLTGVDYHRAGIGGNPEIAADNQKGLPAYKGVLREDVVTFPELLRDAGYHTYMAGKWHMGKSPRNLPGGRGFERSFALLNGGASHWADQLALIPNSKTTYTENDVVVEKLPDDFYSTTYYTDQIIKFIESDLDDDAPFFAYLAFTAPHNPLHAPDASIAKYKGVYAQGWDQLAKKRLTRQGELGLLREQFGPAARPDWVLAWDQLSPEQQAQRERDMEIYAAMIDYMDESIGRLFSFLRTIGEYDNTMIVFMSDNGPSKTAITDYLALGGAAADFVQMFDNSLENKGRPGSSTDIGPGWAFASATPLRLFKGYITQGGIQVPAIIKHPGAQKSNSGGLNDTPLHVTDLMPTFLDVARVTYPAEYNGIAIPGLAGQSLLPLISGDDSKKFTRRGLGWEAYGMDAWLEGDMKLVRLPTPYGNGKWQLYNLQSDPGERNDLAEEKPELVAKFAAKWLEYARTNEVVHPDQPVAYSKPAKPGRF